MINKVFLRFPGAIIVSMVIAILLTLLPLPEVLAVWRPDWILLTLVFWAIIMPKRIPLFLAWFTGLLIDSLYGTILGQHALGFTLVLYFSIRFSDRINPQIIWQQVFMIVIILGLYLVINLWILGVTGKSPNSLNYWLTLFSSIIIWPLWYKVLGFFVVARKHL